MQWIPKNPAHDAVESLASSLRSDGLLRGKSTAAILAPLLVARGIADPESAQRFLSPSLSHLHAPEQMMGLPAAVDRIDAAIERKEIGRAHV